MGDMPKRPIIFAAPMVRGLLREVEAPGTGKTQTRRLITSPLRKCGPGDRLWVRETYAVVDNREYDGEKYVEYRADNNAPHPAGWENAPHDPQALKWRPSIHMPSWASRLTLTVTDVRVQRLQEISEEDAMAEGVTRPILPRWAGQPYRSAFRGIWLDLHGPEAWDGNPFVAALTFTVEPRNIDAAREVG